MLQQQTQAWHHGAFRKPTWNPLFLLFLLSHRGPLDKPKKKTRLIEPPSGQLVFFTPLLHFIFISVKTMNTFSHDPVYKRITEWSCNLFLNITSSFAKVPICVRTCVWVRKRERGTVLMLERAALCYKSTLSDSRTALYKYVVVVFKWVSMLHKKHFGIRTNICIWHLTI